jgi:ABC-type multidrug transport system fused ATPase/permease subunit
MDEENSMPNLGTIKKDHIEGKIEFQNVRFSYDEKQEVLKGVDFKVNPGETVAIKGSCSRRGDSAARGSKRGVICYE